MIVSDGISNYEPKPPLAGNTCEGCAFLPNTMKRMCFTHPCTEPHIIWVLKEKDND